MNSKKDKKQKIPVKLIINYPEDKIHNFHVTGALIGLNPLEGHIGVYRNDPIPEIVNNQTLITKIHQNHICNIKMSPRVFKIVAYAMINHINQYEKKHGKINVEQQLKRIPTNIEVGHTFI